MGLSAWGATVHDEAVHGDLSGYRLAPTTIAVQPGINTLVGSSTPGDLDYFTFTLPAGRTLTNIFLADYNGDSFVSFFAIQRGTSITVPTTALSAAGLLGWTHFTSPGADLLASMSVPSIGSEGFTAPLPAGSYAFWLPEIDADIQYRFDVHVSGVPEASTWAMLACGLGLLGIAHLRRRRPALA